MGRPRNRTCYGCGYDIDDVGPLSQNQLCEECSISRVRRGILEMHFQEGEAFDKWRAGMLDYAKDLIERFGEKDD